MQLSISKASLPCDTLHQRRSYFCLRGLRWTDEGECAFVCACVGVSAPSSVQPASISLIFAKIEQKIQHKKKEKEKKQKEKYH